MTDEQDVLGAPYTTEMIELPDDAEGPVHATLVRRRAEQPTSRAVLHVHGFADYFFQTSYAEWWNERGYDFYAIDLRKYGRSLGEHQTPNYVADLREYFPELDEAWDRVTGRDEHDHVVLSAHSTGGLTLPLWAADRKPDLAGMVLNSPWFDLQGSLFNRTVGTEILKQVGKRQPMRIIPRTVSGLYARSLHRDHEGEFDFDVAWKPIESWPVYAGWLRAIRQGHADLHRGIEVGCPVLVLTSGATAWPKEMGEDVHGHDIVLEVDQIRRWAPSLGRHVTLVSIDGARHDVVLSREPVRSRVYDEIARWHAAYVG
ncbi:alpha/beta hydrolase [Nocardioides guangzhouensis]|uniref:Alpha/beta hydrolase n=1 Tax=Nocardioides guangzhouensis TaxID=2497878 RepID=A0A4Q4ZIV4_9ACTN|nr:alpha/beta hydrolase [Nocardioides guangzhouensis]RYP87491.1 alpha/beta hydrolase [Nocardioides guangzhouensis]